MDCSHSIALQLYFFGEKVRNSYVSSSIIEAQNDVIGIGTKGSDPAYKLNGIFEEPETDQYWDSRYRSDTIHFSGSGLLFLAQLWIDRLTDNFILNSNQYSTIPIPQIDINPTSSIFLVLTASAGWSKYNWVSQADYNLVESTSLVWTPGTGSYKLKTTDNFNNMILSLAIYLALTSLPVTWKYFRAKANGNSAVTLQWQPQRK